MLTISKQRICGPKQNGKNYFFQATLGIDPIATQEYADYLLSQYQGTAVIA